MSVRGFDGVNDVIQLSLGSLNFAFGPGTIAAIVKWNGANAGTSTQTFIKAGTSNVANHYDLECSAGGRLQLVLGTTIVQASTAMNLSASEGWVLIAATKASGTVAVRFHKYVFGTSTWQHLDASTSANSGTPATAARIGSPNSSGQWLCADMGIMGVSNTVFDDAAIEALIVSQSAWSSAAGFVAAWVFDQASVATALPDYIGSADQSSISGTTVVADDIPWPSTDVTITGGTATATATGTNVSVAAGWLVAADSGGATASGDAVVARSAVDIVSGTSSATAAGDTVGVYGAAVIAAGTASAVASGDVATTPGSESVDALSASASATGDDITIRAGYTVVAGSSSADASGANVGLGIALAAGSSDAIASGGSTNVVIAITIYPEGIPSAEAFGTPSLSSTIRTTGIPSAEAFGTPQVFVGSLQIINPTPTPTFGVGAEYSVTHQWKFYLAYSNVLKLGVSNPPPVISELVHAGDVKIDLVLNRPGTMSMTTLFDDDRAQHIIPVHTALVAVRDGVVRWAGPIMSVDRDVATGNINVSAEGWLTLMDYRQIRSPLILPAQTDDIRVATLFSILDAQVSAAGVPQPAPLIYGGHAGHLQMRPSDTWGRGNPAGSILNTLIEIENGFDIKVDPVTRVMTTHREDLLGLLKGLGADRPNTLFAYGTGPDNLMSFRQSIDGSTLANVINAVPDSGPARQTDEPISLEMYGTFESDFPMTGTGIGPEILQAGAVAEVYFRSQPRVTYTVAPFPWTPNSSVPRIFDDYNIGDIVRFAAKRRWFQVPEDLSAGSPQAARVFGATIAIDQNGAERVEGLQLAVLNLTGVIDPTHVPTPITSIPPVDGTTGGVFDPDPGDTGTGGGAVEPTPVDPQPIPADADFSVLVFEENFDGSTIDTNRWTKYNGPGHDGNGLRDPDSLSVHDGMLDIRAWWDGSRIHSGGMSHNQDYLYGRFEVRVRTEYDPTQQLSGAAMTWPQSNNWPHDGELDFYETGRYGGVNRNPFSSFLHWYGATESTQQTYINHSASATDIHTLTMDWTPSYIKIYRDGALIGQLSDPAKIPNVKHHVALQLDALSNNALQNDVHMYVEYVKIWAYTPVTGGTTGGGDGGTTTPTDPVPPSSSGSNSIYIANRKFYLAGGTTVFNMRGTNTHSSGFSFDQQHFDGMKANGMVAQRVCAQWAPIEPQKGVFSQTAIDHVKTTVARAALAGQKSMICLCINSPQWSQKFVLPSWSYTEAGPTNAVAPWNTQSLFDVMVSNGEAYIRRMVAEFKDNPNVVGYEFMNEPDRFPATYVQQGTNRMLGWARAADTTNSKIWFVATNAYSSQSADPSFNNWNAITDWTRVVLQVHSYYAPNSPTDTGWGSNGMRESGNGTFWNGSPEASSYSSANKDALRKHFETWKNISRDKNVPWILGEFGVQYDKTTAAAREAWAKDMVEAASLEECAGIFWWIYGASTSGNPWTATINGLWRPEAKATGTFTVGF